MVRLLAQAQITIPADTTIFVGRHCRHGLHTPGGIGVNKAATALLLGQQGVPGALALRVAVLRRVITLWSMVAIVTINDVLV